MGWLGVILFVVGMATLVDRNRTKTTTVVALLCLLGSFAAFAYVP